MCYTNSKWPNPNGLITNENAKICPLDDAQAISSVEIAPGHPRPRRSFGRIIQYLEAGRFWKSSPEPRKVGG